MKDRLFFVDAETDGLYGTVISFAVIVTDNSGNEMERFYYGIEKSKLQVQDEWVKENVIPKLGDYQECSSQKELYEKFWQVWEPYCERAYAIADVAYPVECQLFRNAVLLKENERKWKAPFPLLDLSVMLYAKGIDPLIERMEFAEYNKDENNQHNALFDVEMSIRIYQKLQKI